jgi:hypothetical protein
LMPSVFPASSVREGSIAVIEIGHFHGRRARIRSGDGVCRVDDGKSRSAEAESNQYPSGGGFES